MKSKILIVHHSGLLGGAGLSLESLLHELRKDYDVVSYVPTSPPDLGAYLEAKGYDVTLFKGRLGKLTIYSGGNPFWSLRFMYHASKIVFHFFIWAKLIARERPDILIVNSRVLAWFSLMPCRAGRVCFVRETVNKNAPFAERLIIRPLLRRFDARVFLSEYDRSESGIASDSDRISPDFTPNPTFLIHERQSVRAAFGLRPTEFVLVFVGGVDPIKGLVILLEALAILLQRRLEAPLNISVLVCGDISSAALDRYGHLYRPSERALIESALKGPSRLFQCIVPIGLVSDLAPIYSAADALVFPMKRPHQSRPAFEIGHFKKPVIISDFPNVAEFYKHGHNALKFKPNDPDSLAAAIDILATDANYAKILGMNNYGECRRIRTAEACIEPIKEILIELEESNRNRRQRRTAAN